MVCSCITALLKNTTIRTLVVRLHEPDMNEMFQTTEFFGDSDGEQNRATNKIRPIVIEKEGERVRLFKRHFGKNGEDFEEWLRRRGLTHERLRQKSGFLLS